MKSRREKTEPKEVLAFCHIEKAAGTSLIHILRRIYFLRYAAVRPMHSRDDELFTYRDLQIARKINPFLLAIGGHSVVPRGDLVHGPDRLTFITQVRDPAARTASQYRFWLNRLKLDTDQSDFLKHPTSKNFQVKKIAGCEDVDLAKENISRHFLLAGTVDKFDAFLVLLADKLEMPLENFTYDRRNVDTSADRIDTSDDFLDRLRERNRLDQQLYEWIDTELFSKYVAEYSGNFASDFEKFRSLQNVAARPRMLPVIDSIYRNAYLKPVSGVIRLSNGLPFRGSYATR